MKRVSHFLPFGQQFIQNLPVRLRGAVQQHNRPRMNPSQQLFKRLLLRRLCIDIPVHIGKTPEKSVIAELFCHLEILRAVFSLRRSVIVRHLLPGHLGKKRGVVVHLFLERGKIRDRRHIGMMIGMVPHRMSLRHHPLGNLRRALQKMSHHKESGRRLVLF